MALWHYGIIALRYYGITALWHYSVLALRLFLTLRPSSIIAKIQSDILAFWHYGIIGNTIGK
jgi:hypothetical protein